MAEAKMAGLEAVAMLGYSVLLGVGLAAWALLHMVPLLRAPRDGDEFAQRFGRVPAALRAAVAGRRVVWVHAVSVGEVLAASRLVGELETALGAGWRVVVSTTTRTGQALARERFGPERVFYYPVDFAFAVRAYLQVLRPEVLVLIESEVWPRMMHECRERGTPVVVVNARVSDRSFGRSLKVRWIWSRVLRRATLWLAQSGEDARRLVAMGAPAERVRVGGNLKYDVRVARENAVAQQILTWADGRAIIVAGSTCEGMGDGYVEPEEPKMVEAFYRLVREQLAALLVIAPRHPERFEEAERAVLTFWYRNASGAPAQNPEEEHPVEVVLLDTIGDLAAVYGIANVAFVGGSLVKRGGHNPLEPAQFGVPVVMGRSYENFRDIVARMQKSQAIVLVKSGKELEETVTELLGDPAAAKAMGARGRRVFEEQQGATARAVEAIVGLVKS